MSVSFLLCIRLGESLVSSSEVKVLRPNRNSALFDTVAVSVQTLLHANEQRSPRKHAGATGFLSFDWNDFVWPLSVPCLHKSHPWKSSLRKQKCEAKCWKLNCFFFLPALGPSVVLSHRSFVLKWLDCFCAAVCLFVYPFLQAHTAFLCISQQCTFSASIGSSKSWTTSLHSKTEELGRRGPLSRA